MLDLVQVRSFLEVAERGTVAAAARALGYTPPAVTQHVAKLERSLDASLFERAGGRLTLTDAGRALVPLASEMVALAVDAPAVVGEATRKRVTVVGIASALAALVTPHLAALRGHGQVVVIEAEDVEALRELRLGHADIAFVQEYPGDRTPRDRRFRYSVVASDDLRLVLPPAWDRSTTMQDLGDLPWLVNGTGTRCEAATRRVLAAADVDNTVAADVSDNNLLLALVAAGHGATIVPDLVLASSTADVTVADTPVGVVRTVLAVTRKRRPPLVDLLLRQART